MAYSGNKTNGGRVSIPTKHLPMPNQKGSMPKGQSKEVPKGKYPNAGKTNCTNC